MTLIETRVAGQMAEHENDTWASMHTHTYHADEKAAVREELGDSN